MTTRARVGFTETSRRDPVCGMEVSSSEIHRTYRGVEYFFCSEQCQARFAERPQLFVGDPQHGKSVKQQGKEVLKAHRIVLREKPIVTQAANIRQAVAGLMGVKDVGINGEQVLVAYDLLQVSLEDIEEKVIEVIGELESGLGEKIKRSYIHYSEECELDNLAHLPKIAI